MDVTSEAPGQVERRLRAVLRGATLEVLEGPFHYQEFGTDRFAERARGDALALVRGVDGWSQLVPVRADDKPGAPLRVWTFHFPPGVPNSGFVGWLASTIQRRCGAGVVVVCGYDSERGGVFDHWGCPAGAAEEVLAVVRELRAPPRRDALCLEGCLMNATVTAERGVIDAQTIFRFQQTGEQVQAEYSGGKLAAGYLVGTLRGDALEFRYCQQQLDGKLDGGVSSCTVERLRDGRLQIREEFEWASRPGTGVNLITELPA